LTAAPSVLAAAGVHANPAHAWCLSRVALFSEYRGRAALVDIAGHYGIPEDVFRPAFDQCIEAGFVRYDGGDLKLTPRGIAEYDRISAAWRDWLASELSDWGEIGDEEFSTALRKVAEQFVTEELTVAAGHR
jgi:hypothetical protein